MKKKHGKKHGIPYGIPLVQKMPCFLSVSSLVAPYQMRLYNHCPFGDFAASIGHSGVKKTILGDPNFFLTQHVEDGGNGAKIVVLFLEDQMYMDYFCHNGYSIFYDTNILYNHYME